MWRSTIIMVAIAACAAFGSRWATAQDLEGDSGGALSAEDSNIGEESHAADMHEAVDEAMKSDAQGTPEPLNHAENMEARNEAHAAKATHSGGNGKHKKAKKKSDKAKRGAASVAKKKKSSKKAKRGTASVTKKKKVGAKSKKKSGGKKSKKKKH